MAGKKRNEEEISAVCRSLPLEPPADVVENIKKRLTAAKLVYRASFYTDPLTGLKHKTALVSCTECGEKYHLQYTQARAAGCRYGGTGDSFGFIDPLDNEPKMTGSTCICPECGAAAEALHINKIRTTFTFDKKYFMTIHNIRGHFVSLSWVTFKECDKDANVTYVTDRYEGIATVDGKPIRYTGYYKGMGYAFSWLDHWEARSVWREIGDEWDADEIFYVSKTEDGRPDLGDADKSALDEYIRKIKKQIRVGAYIQIWCKYPAVENLVRSGLYRFVERVIDKISYTNSYYGVTRVFSIKEINHYIDFKKVKPHEMVGIDKSEIPIAARFSLCALDFYKDTLWTKHIRLTFDQLEQIEKIGTKDFERLLEGERFKGFDPPVVRTLNYLVKQRKKSRNVDPDYLRDYWSMLRKRQRGLPDELKYPGDLVRAHDREVELANEIENKRLSEGISKTAEKFECLSYEDKETGLFIRVAHSQIELINEGKILSHCVGTYANRVAEGKTCILFIRKIEEPEVPFFTLEYNNGRVA